MPQRRDGLLDVGEPLVDVSLFSEQPASLDGPGCEKQAETMFCRLGVDALDERVHGAMVAAVLAKDADEWWA